MYTKPDYVTWISQARLSPHAIACLFLDVTPTTKEPDPATDPHGVAPCIPAGLLDDLDEDVRGEFRYGYHRIYLALTSAVESSDLNASASGKLDVEAAIQYLSQVATRNLWDPSILDCEFARIVLARLPDKLSRLQVEVEALRQQLNDKDSEIDKLRRGGIYSTLALEWQGKAIEEFYSDSTEAYPSAKAVIDWLVESSRRIDSRPLTLTAATKIAAILTPDGKRTGGRPSKK